jgi:hypoxanthine-DNA glycosylase
MSRTETNPFAVFCPPQAKYFILGSFVAKDGRKGHKYDWYYSNGRNQFWPMLEEIYARELNTLAKQQKLFSELGIAIADIIYQCIRHNNSSLDVNLTDHVYNIKPIRKVLENNPIQKILFTSRFVEKEYKKQFKANVEDFPDITLVTLPSPSPRYTIKRIKKLEVYKRELPTLVV